MPERSRSVLFARRALAWSVGWAFSAALYLLLIDITDLPELIVGAGAAVLAAAGFELSREQDIAQLAARARWLGRLHKPLVNVPSDIVAVARVAVERLMHPKAGKGEVR